MRPVYIVHPDRPDEICPCPPASVAWWEDNGYRKVEDQEAAFNAHVAAVEAAAKAPAPDNSIETPRRARKVAE